MADRDVVHASLGSTVEHRFALDGLELVSVRAGARLPEILASYRRDPAVLYAEPDYPLHALEGSEPAISSSNDPLFPRMWNLANTGQEGGTRGADIDAEDAWSRTTGSKNVVVVTIDTGIDYTHPDLAGNMIYSTVDCKNGTAPGGACYGINTNPLASSPNPMDPMDNNGHGTHVGGTIGAVGNNDIGTVGVNWAVGLMACKFLDNTGAGSTSGAIACLDYVHDLKKSGLHIVATNNSWGGGDYSQSLHDAIQAQMQAGILFIAAAGNDFSDNDEFPTYPAGYDLPNIIAVAATDRFDGMPNFSNFGAHTVGLGAPGDLILSTLPGKQYGYDSGTSMAAPHVTGAAALLAADDPSRGWHQIKNLILAGGRATQAMAQTTISGRRLDLYGAMTCTASTVKQRLLPRAPDISAATGVPITLRYQNTLCGHSAGAVTVTVSPTGQAITLADNGAAPDLSAGDGIYSGSWTPPHIGVYTLQFPNQDNVVVTVLGTYTPVPGTSTYVHITGASLDLGDDAVATLTSPFPVKFGGATFRRLFVSSNGTINFTKPFNDSLASGIQTLDPTISTLVAPLWLDLYPVSGTPHNVFWQVTGAAPNRKLVIEWRQVQVFECKYDPSATVTFETVFSESSNTVEFNYAHTEPGTACIDFENGNDAVIAIQTGSSQVAYWNGPGQTVEAGMSLLWQLNAKTPESGIPTLTSVTPSTIHFGSPDTTVSIVGSGFTPYSHVVTSGWVPTTYISSTQLKALIPAEDFSWTSSSDIWVTVYNPGTKGGSSNPFDLKLVARKPSIASISPNTISAGGYGFSLYVSGSNFIFDGTQIKWNDTYLQTYVMSPTGLFADVPASLFAAAGTASIVVDNKVPDGLSNAATIKITSASAGSGPGPSQNDLRSQALEGRFLGWGFSRIAGDDYTRKFKIEIARHKMAEPDPSIGSITSTTKMPGLDLRATLPAGYLPSGVAIGDFNGDGIPDWAVTMAASNTVWIYFGKGDGTAKPPVVIPLLGISPVWITTADTRKNGILDLIVGEADSGSLGVLLGKGNGTFEPERLYYVEGAAMFVATGDFNGDGKLDILAGLGGGTASLAMLPGNGDGTFGEPINSDSPWPWQGTLVTWLATGDIDGDGKPDVVAVDEDDESIVEYINRGDGTFGFMQEIGYNSFAPPVSASLGDLNHDGCLDLVEVGINGTAETYLGDCNGNFGPASYATGLGDAGYGSYLADVNGDGNLDLVTAGTLVFTPVGYSLGVMLSVLTGDGHGNLGHARIYRGGQSAFAFALGDLRKTGHLDVVAANQDNDTVTVFLNDGKGDYGQPEGEYVGVLNGDLYLGTQNSPLTTAQPVDVNSDGKTDLAFFQITGSGVTAQNLSVLLNKGNGEFSAPISTPLMGPGYIPYDFAFGDFRNSGHPDLIFSTAGGADAVFVARGNGDGTFQQPVQVATPGGTLAVGDLNHDGRLDFVLCHPNPSGGFTLTVFLGNGNGTFSKGQTIDFATSTPPGNYQSVFVADVLGNGKLDILIQLSNNGAPWADHDVYEFLGNGNGTFQAARKVIDNPGYIRVADLNHDGRADIVSYRDSFYYFPKATGRPEIDVYLAQPDGSYPLTHSYSPFGGNVLTPGLGVSADGNLAAAWIGDFNGDGHLDIAVFQENPKTYERYVQFLVGNGDGSFTPDYKTFSLSTLDVPDTAADVTGDGITDLLTVDFVMSAVHIIPGRAQ